MAEKVPESLEALRKFLNSEIDDYSLEHTIELTEEYGDASYYTVTISSEYGEKKEKDVYFKYEDKKLYIEVHEDHWEKITHYDWNVKYFWMAFLEWPF